MQAWVKDFPAAGGCVLTELSVTGRPGDPGVYTVRGPDGLGIAGVVFRGGRGVKRWRAYRDGSGLVGEYRTRRDALAAFASEAGPVL